MLQPTPNGVATIGGWCWNHGGALVPCLATADRADCCNLCRQSCNRCIAKVELASRTDAPLAADVFFCWNHHYLLLELARFFVAFTSFSATVFFAGLLHQLLFLQLQPVCCKAGTSVHRCWNHAYFCDKHIHVLLENISFLLKLRNLFVGTVPFFC